MVVFIFSGIFSAKKLLVTLVRPKCVFLVIFCARNSNFTEDFCFVPRLNLIIKSADQIYTSQNK